MVAMVIETPLDQSGIEALFADNRAEYLKARTEHAVAIESGSTLALFPGDKATAFAPSRPSNGFGAFQENVGRIIALAYDMPYELLFKDFTKANYSSMRAAMLEAWRSFNRRRDDLGTQWADPVYMLFLEEAINAGKIEGPDFYAVPYAYARCTWIGPGRGMVDPVKEAQAAEIRIRTRISTYRDECAEQGRDWQEVMDQQATEFAYADKRRLPAPSSGTGGPVVGYTDSTLGPDGPPDTPPGNRPPNGPQPPNQSPAGAIVPTGRSPEVAELRERLAGLEGGWLAAAARPMSATPQDVQVTVAQATDATVLAEAVQNVGAVIGQAMELMSTSFLRLQQEMARPRRSELEILERDEAGFTRRAVKTESPL
jgi:hypothetical protein